MNTNDKDKLYSLFQESKSMIPEIDIENCLMDNIRQISEKREQKRHLYHGISLVVALVAIVAVPLICLSIFDILPTMNFSANLAIFRNLESVLANVSFKSPFLFIPYVIFFLLIFDLFIRKKIWNQEHSQEK